MVSIWGRAMDRTGGCDRESYDVGRGISYSDVGCEYHNGLALQRDNGEYADNRFSVVIVHTQTFRLSTEIGAITESCGDQP